MNFKIVTLIVLIGVFNVNASSPAISYIRQRAEAALHEQMIKSLSAPMPRSSISQCHPHYSELLNSVLETYENDLQKCEEKEKEQLAELVTEGQQSRDTTSLSLENVCKGLETCKTKDQNLEFFDCVNQSGDKNTRDLWKAARDSSETAANMRERMHVIKYETGRCTSTAERTYVVETAKAIDDMTSCYANGGNITTEAPSTSSTDGPETDAPATDAPATEAPSTESPATETPETDTPSTDAPETEAPATEAPSTDEPETDAPATEEPATEAPATEAPSTEAPETETFETVTPATEAPATEAPETETPATEEPATEAPETEAPATEAPSTEAPETETFETDTPATEAPATEAPETDAPASAEMDQIEELEENSARTRLENFMKNWGKRF